MSKQFEVLWKTNKPLTTTSIFMLAVLIISLIGVFVDPRIITGMPAWLKPAKFALSLFIYTGTLAWVFRYLPGWPRLRLLVGWITSVAMVIEIVIISLQAARGTTSHFNVATPFDQAMFATMGVVILIAWITLFTLATALFRQTFDNRSMGWALRIGTIITVVGAATGGLMTRPTDAQLADARGGHAMTISGAHTVGAPDGGKGLPGIGWSREHGDLRVPHFLGLHAMQIIPLIVWLLKLERPGIVVAVGGMYAAVFILTLLQALAGRPFPGGV